MADAQEDKNIGFAADLISVIHHSKIFADIDRDACIALLPHLERIFLPQGEILFEQNDPSDCLYILVNGQLTAILSTAEKKQKIIGFVEKGETVGELGVLSNQPRSLTIRAAVNSRLLKLPRSEFEKFCKEQPTFVSRIIDLIISRSQNTIKVISQKKMYRHIAIIPGNDAAPLDHFIVKLKKNLSENSNIVVLEHIPKGADLEQIMEEAEQENLMIMFAINEENLPDLHGKLSHLGGIFVLVDGDTPSILSDFALNMLSRDEAYFATQYELILTHDDHIQKPVGTIQWLNQANFTLHHHIKKNDDAAYKRIIRFMTGKANGLVLGGGGNKGWVSIGVLKALLEEAYPIDAIGGTSVGALVGACYAKNLNFKDTYEDFKRLVVAAGRAYRNITWPIISLVSAKTPTEVLIEVFDNIKIEDLWIPFFAMSSNLNTGKETVHTQGYVWKKMRATAAIPGLAPPMVLDGAVHFDGGLLNNLPVDCMRSLLGNESTIIAVSLTGGGQVTQQYNFPPVLPFWVGLFKKLGIGYKSYKFPPFFQTFIEAMLVGSSAKEKSNELLADVLIQPDLSKFRSLAINTKIIDTLIDIGYKTSLDQIQTSYFFLE